MLTIAPAPYPRLPTSHPGPSEAVVAAPRAPGAYPSVERVRLGPDYRAATSARGREKDMVQYYQYSADQGNTDAAAAIGQLFSVGVRGIDQARSAALLLRLCEAW